MPERARWAVWATAAALFAVLIVVLGWAYPPRPAVVSTDRLGPVSGEPVADYLARAHRTLDGADTADHWALVSFTAGLSPDRIPEHANGLRVSQVVHHVPIDRVTTPFVTIPVPAGDEVAVASARAAAGLLSATPPADERSARITAVVADRLRSGCPCTVGLVVRGPLGRLRELATHNDIRAVEVLPADAGVFGLAPLLPEYTDTAASGPDDGPIPER
ncbi:hypothetical protein ACWDSJ_18490 [Nocardia sp. NPDC003482]